MVLSVLVFSYLYRIVFYIWYLSDEAKEPEKHKMRYMIIGTFMYIFGEGLPIVIIFTMHYYKFVYQPAKEAVINGDSILRNCSTNKKKYD